MREIKFRAWDLSYKKMYSWEDLDNNDKDGLIHLVDLLNDKEFGLLTLQFTGLHDKKGVEIYEGDILGGYPHGNSVVKWDTEYGCWHSGKDLIGNEIKNMPERIVIGNIYSNPELLTPNP